MQPRLTLSALSTWYVVTDLLSDSYQYLKQFSSIGRNAEKHDNNERGSDGRNKSQPRRIVRQENKPARRQETTHEPGTQQARESTRTEGSMVRQDRAHMAEIGRKGDKTASHRRTPVASKPARKTVNQDRAHMAKIGRKGGEKVSQNRAHMAEIGRKGGETVSQNREHMAEIGHKGGEKISQDREHMAEIGHKGGEKISQDREHMAEIGRKGHEDPDSKGKGQSRNKGRNG
jgi:hypothetical protein